MIDNPIYEWHNSVNQQYLTGDDGAELAAGSLAREIGPETESPIRWLAAGVLS
jgi:hypothetical protein